MVEKKLLMQLLTSYCDTIGGYEYSSDSIYIYCDKIAESFEGKRYPVKELIASYKEKFEFEAEDGIWQDYLNENYLRTFFEEKKQNDNFQIAFHVRDEEQKYYSIQIEKLDKDNLMVTGKNLFEEINARSLHKSLRKSLDSILNIDTNTGSYFISYSTDPEDSEIDGFNYEKRIKRYIEHYVVEAEKQVLLKNMSLEHVKDVLKEQEDYTLFMTIYDEKEGFKYKRVLYSYFDSQKKLITVSRMDISNVVQRYETQIRKIKEENDRDALTGIYNRNFYEANIKDTVMRAGIAVIDIDDFKLYNDAYGHNVGDAILVKVGEIIKEVTHEEDITIRYGGDEFLLILPDISEKELKNLLRDIQECVYSTQIQGYEQMRLSVSIGGVIEADETVEHAVYRADQLMYRAKCSKNMVITEQDCVDGENEEALYVQSLKKRQQILIVDDSETNRLILTHILQNDYRILDAKNGQEALNLIEQYGTGISLVLLDIIMPVKDGFEVLAYMNKTHRIEEIPVIMISSDSSDANIERAYSLGISDYIARPFDSKVVYRRVLNIIMLYTKQRKLISMLAQQLREKEMREKDV